LEVSEKILQLYDPKVALGDKGFMYQADENAKPFEFSPIKLDLSANLVEKQFKGFDLCV